MWFTRNRSHMQLIAHLTGPVAIMSEFHVVVLVRDSELALDYFSFA